MGYSEKLNGYWEEGYHYYMEFRDDKLTMREYRRKVILETTVSYDAAALDRGEETEIVPADPVFDRWPDGRMAMEIRSLRYVGGELKLLEYYTIMGVRLPGAQGRADLAAYPRQSGCWWCSSFVRLR